MKHQLVDLAAERGHFPGKNHKKSIIKINSSTYKCFITIIFDTGPRYRFGAVYFNPNPFDTKFLERYVPFKSRRVFR